MSRFTKLVDEIEKAYPNDWWLSSFRLLPEIDDAEIFSPKIAIYERALNSLDEGAWDTLKEKIFVLYKQDQAFRGKRAFFDQLNEAFAYEFLKGLGGTRIEFIAEQPSVGTKTPDLSFLLNGKQGLCEVKTINNSNEELGRQTNEEIFSSSVYQELDSGFFNKFESDVRNACAKFFSGSSRNLVYLIVHFDDLTGMYCSSYKQQIVEFIRTKFPQSEFYIQIGLGEIEGIYFEGKNA